MKYNYEIITTEIEYFSLTYIFDLYIMYYINYLVDMSIGKGDYYENFNKKQTVKNSDTYFFCPFMCKL